MTTNRLSYDSLTKVYEVNFGVLLWSSAGVRLPRDKVFLDCSSVRACVFAFVLLPCLP